MQEFKDAFEKGNLFASGTGKFEPPYRILYMAMYVLANHAQPSTTAPAQSSRNKATRKTKATAPTSRCATNPSK